MIIGFGEAVAWGGLGGLMLSVVDLVEDLNRPARQRRSGDPTYWVGFVFRPATGVLLVLLYLRSDSTLNALSAFGTGLTAPSTLQVLAKRAYTPSTRMDSTET